MRNDLAPQEYARQSTRLLKQLERQGDRRPRFAQM